MFKTNDFQIGRARPIANIFCTETIRTQTKDLASSMQSTSSKTVLRTVNKNQDKEGIST